MRRRRRRPPPVARPGDLVIDGRVRARLLGLRLLDLDAHVVVATAPAVTAAHEVDRDRRAMRDRPAGRGGRALPAAPDRSGARVGSAPPELARAVRLLAEGATALEDARRLGR